MGPPPLCWNCRPGVLHASLVTPAESKPKSVTGLPGLHQRICNAFSLSPPPCLPLYLSSPLSPMHVSLCVVVEGPRKWALGHSSAHCVQFSGPPRWLLVKQSESRSRYMRKSWHLSGIISRSQQLCDPAKVHDMDTSLQCIPWLVTFNWFAYYV
jgi:hypothetical protein